jgi:hypothetical protein
MKFKGFGLGIVCIVALSLLTFSGQIKPTDQPQVQKEVIPGGLSGKIMVSPGIDKGWPGLVSLGKKVREDINALQNSFKDLKSGPGQIAALLDQRRGVISRERYELIYGKDSQAFWSNKQAEGTTLEIEIAMVYVSNVTGPHPKLPFPEEKTLKLPMGGGAFNAVAFVVVEFHFIKKTKEGAFVHNDTYSGELGYRHQLDCQWGN